MIAWPLSGVAFRAASQHWQQEYANDTTPSQAGTCIHAGSPLWSIAMMEDRFASEAHSHDVSIPDNAVRRLMEYPAICAPHTTPQRKESR
jgi:hypothetical protein